MAEDSREGTCDAARVVLARRRLPDGMELEGASRGEDGWTGIMGQRNA